MRRSTDRSGRSKPVIAMGALLVVPLLVCSLAVAETQDSPAGDDQPNEKQRDERDSKGKEAQDISDEKLAEQTELILGLDGTAYRPYKTSVIEWVQQELKQRELFDGTINGVLDEETKKAIAAFQESEGLYVSGIPSPKTRRALREDVEESESDDGPKDQGEAS